jgi:hypothetical protein
MLKVFRSISIVASQNPRDPDAAIDFLWGNSPKQPDAAIYRYTNATRHGIAFEGYDARNLFLRLHPSH